MVCKNYVGISCIDGSCPCIDTVLHCENCFYYGGCDDCYFFGTVYCEIHKDSVKEDFQ